ncbi:LpqB family beta-propeller domain-containing protein [Streptomyces aurantiacus]|uniref:LpqB family beta-propeller domain-containing protein n=1 Tax=Streptomyces aurantiacus TaxID=47760 RepID=UPI00040EE747|nr:LpqB family beta-propeller domain-containing protein [Streptomyces aurantiacus]
MGAEGQLRGRTRPLRAGLVLAACGALLAGCASMPDEGNMKKVDASQRPDSQSQVRVYAMPPPEDAGAVDIVQGFLEALTSDDPDFAIARKYLTKKASDNWHPERSTTVLADGPNTVADNVGNDNEGERTYALTGRRLATVNEQRAYKPDAGAYRQAVHLTQQNGPNGRVWRIDAPPPGVVIGESDFERNYQAVNKYYFASPPKGLGTARQVGRQQGLVADPIFVRQRIDPLTETVKALLGGPTNWLRQVVRTAVPEGARLAPDTKSLTPDDKNKLVVPLNARADTLGHDRCTEMAAQLLFTLQDLTASGVEQVELQRTNGSQLCVLSKDRAETVAPHRTADLPAYQYFVDGAKKRLVRMPGNTGSNAAPEPVTGPFGEGEQPLRSAAVSRDEERGAGVSLDGRRLYTASLVSKGSLGGPELRSRSKSESDGFSTPSWDVRGDLWVADRDPKRPRLLWLAEGTGEPVQVNVPGLDGSIKAVRVAADGVRVALLVEKGGKTSLRIGRIDWADGKGGQPDISIVELLEAAPQMEEVTAMSWAGVSRLVVVGRESGGVQQMRYVQSDGSARTGATLPGLTGVKEIAASEDERQPLVAHSDDGIVRLPSGAQWQTVVKDGAKPVYPG